MPVAVNNTAIPNTGPAPLVVTFHGEAGIAASYMYNIIVQFGDATPNFTLAGGPGTTFFDTNHTYVTGGIYPAVMTFNTDVNVINPIITNFTITVTAPPAPVVDFMGSPLTGDNPLSVTFTDLSTNSPTSWLWDFGDASPLGTTQNPTHIYASAGTYSVTLTATNAGGSGNLTKTNYIVVTTPNYLVYKTKIQGGGIVYSSSNPLSPDINFGIKGNLAVSTSINVGDDTLANGSISTPDNSSIDLVLSTNTNGVDPGGNINLSPSSGGIVIINGVSWPSTSPNLGQFIGSTSLGNLGFLNYLLTIVGSDTLTNSQLNILFPLALPGQNVAGPTVIYTCISIGEWRTLISGNTPQPLIINTQLSDYTIQLSDAYNTLIRITKATPAIVTIPNDSAIDMPLGSAILIGQNGAGSVTLVADVGVTLVSPESLVIGKQYGKITIIKTAANYWEIEGNLAP